MSKLLLILLTGLAYGTSIVVTRFAIAEIPPVTLVGFRFLIASAAFLIAFFLFKESFPFRKHKVNVAIFGILTAGVPITAFTLSLQFISSAVMAIFLSMVPLATAIAAHIFLLDEKISVNKIAGLLLAFGGAVFLILTNTTGLADLELNILGPILALAAVISISAGTVFARARLKDLKSLVATTGQAVTAFVFVSPFAFLLTKTDYAGVSINSWLAVGYNGLVGSFAAFWLSFILIKKYGATSAMLPTYIIPLISGVFGALLLGEVISPPLIIGAAVILSGVFLANR